MRRISNKPVRFVVRLKEVRKYGLCPPEQVKRNPEAKLLFPKKEKEVENVSKGNSKEK